MQGPNLAPNQSIAASHFLKQTVWQCFATSLKARNENANQILQKVRYLASQRFELVNAENFASYMDYWKELLEKQGIQISTDSVLKEKAIKKHIELTKTRSIDPRLYQICRGCLSHKEATELFPSVTGNFGLLRISCSAPTSASFGQFVLESCHSKNREFSQPQTVPKNAMTLDYISKKIGGDVLTPDDFSYQKAFFRETGSFLRDNRDFILHSISLSALQEVASSSEKIYDLWQSIFDEKITEHISGGGNHIFYLDNPEPKTAPCLPLLNQKFCLFLSDQLTFEQFLAEKLNSLDTQAFLTFSSKTTNLAVPPSNTLVYKEKTSKLDEETQERVLVINEKPYLIQECSERCLYEDEQIKILRRTYHVEVKENETVNFIQLAYEGDDSFSPDAFAIWQKELYALNPELKNETKDSYPPYWIYKDGCYSQISRFVIGHDLYLEWQKCLLNGYNPEELGKLQIFLQGYWAQIHTFWSQPAAQNLDQFSTLMHSLSHLSEVFKHDYADNISALVTP